MKKKIILGLDVSTTCTGYSIIDTKKNIIEAGWIETPTKKHLNLFTKAKNVRCKLLELKEKYDVDFVYIEKSLQSFSRGRSSANTLHVLAMFNGIVSWLCVEIFEIFPTYLGASFARKDVGVKVKKGEKAKAKVMEFMLDKGYIKEVEYTKKGNIKAQYFDKADAIVIALAGVKDLRTKEKDSK